MTPGAVLAAAAAAGGVWAVWAALGAAEHGLGRLLLAAGPDGRVARVLSALYAGEATSRAERRRLAVVGGVVLLAAGWILAGPLGGVALAACVPWVGARVLAGARRRRRERLAAVAPAVARAIADALAGGHSVRGALTEAASGGVAEPAGTELRIAAAELALGARTGDVLERWRARATHPVYDSMTAAILLQRDAGGDLAGLLRGLAASLEEQVRAEADARSLTAQARFTALIVAVLPLAAAGLAELGRPGYLASLLAQPFSAVLIATSLALQVLAGLAVRRIARMGS